MNTPKEAILWPIPKEARESLRRDIDEIVVPFLRYVEARRAELWGQAKRDKRKIG